MERPPPEVPHPSVKIREMRASSVIVQAVPADHVEAFVAWQHGIAGEAAGFPGYQSTELYPPVEEGDPWVIVIHFGDHEKLEAWLVSPLRADWVARLPTEVQGFRVETMPAGFGSWVAGLTERGVRVPHWKSFLLVLVGLYPTVMVLSIVVSPQTERLGFALQVLVGNIASVAFLEWVGMPALNRALGPWLRASGRDGRIVALVGLVLVVVGLVAMALLFRFAVG
jgi:antibiotic biosynthesis monooxygenase (ABM) superfamily enzyme